MFPQPPLGGGRSFHSHLIREGAACAISSGAMVSESKVEALEKQVLLLTQNFQAKVDLLEERMKDLESQVAAMRVGTQVHINMGNVTGASASTAEVPGVSAGTSSPGAPAGDSAGAPGVSAGHPLEAAGGTFHAPTATVPVSGLDSAVKHYTVVVGNSTPAGMAGTYRTYGRFADAVRDPAIVWSGRGKICFAAGAQCESFASRRDAEAFYRERTGLDPALPVPHWG